MIGYSINVCTLKEMAYKGLLRDFAIHLFYKSKVRKGRIFNASDEMVGKKLGLKKTAVRKYRKFWLDMGWCEMHAGNLIFKTIRGEEKDHTLRIKITNLKDTIDEVYFQLFQLSYRQFEHLRSASREIIKAQSLKAYKWGKKVQKKYGRLPGQNDKYKISFKKLAKVFGCSEGKAHYVVQRLIKKYGIQVTKRVEQIAGIDNNRLRHIKNELHGTFVSKKYVYKVCCNEYVF